VIRNKSEKTTSLQENTARPRTSLDVTCFTHLRYTVDARRPFFVFRFIRDSFTLIIVT